MKIFRVRKDVYIVVESDVIDVLEAESVPIREAVIDQHESRIVSKQQQENQRQGQERNDYDPALGFDLIQLVMTIGGYLIALSVLIFIINLIYSIKHGEKAEGNLWNSRSPEWQVPSPMPVHNYDVPFEVVGEPYDYGLKDSKYIEFSPNGKKHIEFETEPEVQPHRH